VAVRASKITSLGKNDSTNFAWKIDERKALKAPYDHASHRKHPSHFELLLLSPVPLLDRSEVADYPGVDFTFFAAPRTHLMLSVQVPMNRANAKGGGKGKIGKMIVVADLSDQ
jgi:hypothetical protein